jgi:hypothetical protein
MAVAHSDIHGNEYTSFKNGDPTKIDPGKAPP